MTTTNPTYSLILDAIKSGTCSRDALYATIDEAFGNGDLTPREARMLEAAIG